MHSRYGGSCSYQLTFIDSLLFDVYIEEYS